MSKSNMTYTSSGKAKDIYETADDNLLFEFTDRVTAFNGKKKAEYQEKGEIIYHQTVYCSGYLWERYPYSLDVLSLTYQHDR